MNKVALTVFSFGGGQDSFAILYKIIFDKDFREKYVQGRLVVIMAETGNEHKETYQFVEEAKVLCETHGIEFIHLDYTHTPRVWKGGLTAFYRAYNRIGSKAFPKTCTDNLKIKPIYNFLGKWIHEQYKTVAYGNKKEFYEFTEKFGGINVIIGIAKGEEKRISDTTKGVPVWMLKNVTKIFPLVYEGWGRKECQEIITGYGYAVPPPSNCIICPFLSKQELLFMYRFNNRWYKTFVILEQRKIDAFEIPGKPGKALNAKGLEVDNLGVFGKKLLPEILQETIAEFGHWSDEQLKEYKMSHGHCVKSKY